MDSIKKTGLRKQIQNTILSIVAILAIYLGFRAVVGNFAVEKIDRVVNLYSYNLAPQGVVLNEIQSTKYQNLSETRSNVLENKGQNLLTGSTGLKTSNPKILAMRKFLLDYNSPMYGYSEVFVTEAEKYDLDWRLVASISGVESAFGNLIPNGTNNGWGWRGGPAGAYSIFPTWKEGIQTITRGLALGYGITLTPFDIEQAYCPPCYANPAHAWANGVTRFMNELDYYLENLEKI